MQMIIVLVFLGTFSVAALLLIASGQGAAQKAKQVVATLESALATENPQARRSKAASFARAVSCEQS